MRILFVGDLNEYSRSFQRRRALGELADYVGEVATVPMGVLPGISPGPTLYERCSNKIGLPLDPIRANRHVIESVQVTDFDILWIEKGVTIRPQTIREIKARKPRTLIVSFSEDDMFNRLNSSHYYRRSLPLYDVVFTTKSYNCRSEELPSLGARRVIFVDKAYDRYTHRPIQLTDEERRRFGADVGFVGTFEKERAEVMLQLASAGLKVTVWGNGWFGWTNRHENLIVKNQPLYGDDYIRAICATKVNLGFLRKINRDLQTDRSLEIPACGALMLAERTDQHRRLFEEGKEADYFEVQDLEELYAKVRFYLAHKEKRWEVAEAGRRRCVESGYSHHDRLGKMLATIMELKRGGPGAS